MIQKSPLRRCFKPRPPLSTGCTGFASGCRSHWRSVGPWSARHLARKSSLFRRRLSGLLSGPHRSTRSHRHVRNWASEKYVIHLPDARIMTAAHNTNRRARHVALVFVAQTSPRFPKRLDPAVALVGQRGGRGPVMRVRDVQVIAIGHPFEPVAPLIGDGVKT